MIRSIRLANGNIGDERRIQALGAKSKPGYTRDAHSKLEREISGKRLRERLYKLTAQHIPKRKKLSKTKKLSR